MDVPIAFRQRMEALPGNLWPLLVEAYRLPLRRGVRVNTNKLSIDKFRALFPHPLTPSPFCEESFYLDTEHKAGSDPLHHAGAYYMQEPSAASAVTVLAPKPGERVLDLCAAPGGKSTQILSAMQNKGLLWSNEYVTGRARILQQNVERMGSRCSIISNSDTAPLCSALAGYFDAVLVDAPCSGEGMFRKEPQALECWSEDNIALCAARQHEILNNAANAVAPGGRLVYSTCTFAVEENEGVIARFLHEHPDFELLPIEVPWGSHGFAFEDVSRFIDLPYCSHDLTRCRRIFPHQGGEGHFIALLKRADVGIPSSSSFTVPTKDPHRSDAEALYNDCFTTAAEGHFVTVGQTVRLLPADTPALDGLHIIAAGIAVAQVCKNRLEPEHGVFLASSINDCRRNVDLCVDDPLLLAYLHGEEINVQTEGGWTAVCVEGIPVGYGKTSGNRLKNRYPKGLRLL